ncbi:DHA2 family efflux MFS transporter permease subunit [Methylococcus sp. Mc7]|uniref:DHA2 family efflux MFS transporter permease subunit n=1 Tax=Methylococcus sp. Mc7 TaxID=2860258 RepID=UPI001C52E54B|nr:DHA2 family efflux MFS transporter permease subunit [Methylococcus sp. Mc7]QXP84405.1 DHA2 family efflux MFS transporter permease subunit [Methylococcus sp. Mc7]
MTVADNVTPRAWIGFFGMVFGVFMAILDIQIVASSLEQIQAGLAATRDEITWVQTAYLIAEVVIIPLSGWLNRALSTRYLFVLSCGGFTLTSLCCALAWNLPSMIAFRALQGFFGGAMIPTVFAVIYTLFPPRQQAAMVIVVGMVVTVAPTAGPVLGGYLTEVLSWKALFLVNLLPGILVCLSTWFLVEVDRPEWALLKRVDFPGILYICVFLGSLQFVLEEGIRKEWFDSREIVFFSAVAVIAGGAMFYRELRIEEPIVDLWAFRNTNFAVGCLFSFIIGIGLYTLIALTPIYLSTVKGLNSLQIGQYLMVTGMFQFASAFVAGPLAKRMDSRLMLATGMFLFGLGTWQNGNLSHDSGYWEFFWPQALRGFALMFAFLPINSLALGTLPPEEVKNASGLYNLTRNLGGAIGIAVANTLMIRWDKAHYAVLRESVTPGSPQADALLARLETQAAALRVPDPADAALKQLYGLAMREAQIMTVNDLFHVLGLLFFASLLLMPLVRKVRHDAGDTGAH